MERAKARLVAGILLALGNCCEAVRANDASADQYAVAAGHYAADRWQLACDEFQIYLADFPADEHATAARFYLAESLVQIGKSAEAQQQFAELLKQDADSPLARQALFRKAEAHFLSGDDKQARQDLEAFQQRYPSDDLEEFILPYLGELSLRDEAATTAVQHYHTALQRFPQGALAIECRFGLARAHQQLGQFDQALQELQQLAGDVYAPLADKAQFQLGVLHNAAGRYEEALQAFDAFAKNFKDSPLAAQMHLARGWSLYKQEKYEPAEAEFRQLLEDADHGREARYWLGMVFAAQQKWAAAIEQFEAAAGDTAPHRLQAAIAFQLAEALRQQGSLERSAEQFSEVLRRWPADPYADDARFGALQVAIKREDHTAAIKLAEAFLQQHPDSPLQVGAECYATIAVCHARLGQHDEASQALAQLKDKFPASDLVSPTLYKMAEAHYQSGNAALARELFTQLTTEGNDKEWVSRGLAGLAWTQLKSEDLQESASTFERLLKEHPDQPLAASAALARGQTLEKLGETESALAMFRSVFKDYPQSTEAPAARLRAALLHDRLKQFSEARTLYQELEQSEPPLPNLAEVHYHRGCLESADDQEVEACRQWQRVLDAFPESDVWADAVYRLAASALAEGKADDCAAHLASLEAQPARVSERLQPHVLYLAGRLNARREQWLQVAAPLAKLIEQFPDHALAPSAAWWMAEADYRQGKYSEAEPAFAQLELKLQGVDKRLGTMARLRRAQSLAQRGQWTQSLELARSISAEHPDFDALYEVDYLIGRGLASAADFTAAREAYTRVTRSPQGAKTETAAMAQWMIGESYFHQEDYSAALRAYLRVEILYAFPQWQAAALLQAGKCYEQLNQWKPAAETYSRLLTTYPNSEVAEEASNRLGIAQKHRTPPVTTQ